MRNIYALPLVALLILIASCASDKRSRTSYSMAGSPLMSARQMTNTVNAHLASPGMMANMKLDQPLRLERGVPPLYPNEARKRGIQGPVVVQMTISETGDTKRVIVKNAAHDILEQATMLAVSEWKFSRPMRDGKATETNIELPIRFRP
jgi:TonB family protein